MDKNPTRDHPSLEELSTASAEELLRFAYERYGDRAAIGTSGQKTGVVIIDIAHRLGLPLRVFFIDTLLNHEETYELLDEIEQRYGIEIERFRPDRRDIEELSRTVGQYAHFLARPECCRVRKHKPLQRALGTLDCWISGLRADQSRHRSETAPKAEWACDESGRRILKLNPLLEWTQEDVESHTQRFSLPYNRLYDYVSPHGERYTVIGCPCCHIPVLPDMPDRAGKFPWERGKKECGLHENGSGI
ncbi:MAG: phosphoadenylyl-sulfate reductase [Phycisphaerae bacterium]